MNSAQVVSFKINKNNHITIVKPLYTVLLFKFISFHIRLNYVNHKNAD